MRSTRSFYLFGLAALWLLKAPASAAERPTIEVEFLCTESVYCPPLSSAELQQSLARELRARLGSRFRCFEFVETGGTYRLTVELNRRDPSFPVDDVVFWISLTRGKEMLTDSPIDWLFRTKDQYNEDLGNAKQFRAQLCRGLSAQMTKQAQLDRLTLEVLGKVLMADRAYPIPETPDWAMPFSRDETGLAEGSLFRVEAQYRAPRSGLKKQDYRVLARGVTDDPDLPRDYLGKILGETQPDGEWRGWPPQLRVQGIYLTKPQLVPRPVLQPHAPPGRKRPASDCLFQ